MKLHIRIFVGLSLVVLLMGGISKLVGGVDYQPQSPNPMEQGKVFDGAKEEEKPTLVEELLKKNARQRLHIQEMRKLLNHYFHSHQRAFPPVPSPDEAPPSINARRVWGWVMFTLAALSSLIALYCFHKARPWKEGGVGFSVATVISTSLGTVLLHT